MRLFKNNSNLFSYTLFLLSLLNAAFVLLYAVLAYNNRFSFEDLYFIETLRQQGGIAESVKFYYNNWSGRWAAFSYFYLWFGFAKTHAVLNILVFCYHVFTLAVLVYSIVRIFKKAMEHMGIRAISRLAIINISLLFCAALFFFSFQLSESWWWLCSSFFHLQSAVFFCLSLSAILNDKAGWLQYTLIALCGIYIGASSEVMAALVLVLIPASFIYLFIVNRSLQKGLSNSLAKKSACLLASVAFSLLFNFLAPGTPERREALGEIVGSTDGSILRFYDGGGSNILHLFNHPKYLLSALFLLLLFFTSTYFIKQEKMSFKKNNILFIVILFALSIVVPALIHIYAFRDNIGPLRSWMPVNLIWILLFSVIVIFIGANINMKNIIRNIFFFCSLIICISIIITYTVRHAKIASAYSFTYDSRLHLLKNTSLSTTQIDSACSPVSSGMLIDTRITRESFEQLNLFQ